MVESQTVLDFIGKKYHNNEAYKKRSEMVDAMMSFFWQNISKNYSELAVMLKQ